MDNADLLETGQKPAPGRLAFVQGFVNTHDVESGRDDLATVADLRSWLERHGLLRSGVAVSPQEHERALGFREALRTLLLTNNGEQLAARTVAALTTAGGEAPLRLTFTTEGDLELSASDDSVAGALATLQATIYEAMLLGTWPRLKACLNDACHWAFYDASKNRSGTWCSMEVCGNRMKVRSHRERHQKG